MSLRDIGCFCDPKRAMFMDIWNESTDNPESTKGISECCSKSWTNHCANNDVRHTVFQTLWRSAEVKHTCLIKRILNNVGKETKECQKRHCDHTSIKNILSVKKFNKLSRNIELGTKGVITCMSFKAGTITKTTYSVRLVMGSAHNNHNWTGGKRNSNALKTNKSMTISVMNLAPDWCIGHEYGSVKA